MSTQSKPSPKPTAAASPRSSSESTATLSSQGSSALSSPSSSSMAVPKVKSPLNPSSSSSFSPSPSGSSASRTRERGHSFSALSSSRESSPNVPNAANNNLLASTSAGALLSPPLSPALSQTLTIRPGDAEESLSASSSFRLRSRSRPKAPGPLEEFKDSIAPTSLSAWWRSDERKPRPWKESPKRKATVPDEQMQGWMTTRDAMLLIFHSIALYAIYLPVPLVACPRRVAQAVSSVLGNAQLVGHEALLLSVDLLELAPVPGLRVAASTLLEIWDALQLVDDNRIQCLRLTEHCADILLSVRQEVWDAGDQVGEELMVPIARLSESFATCLAFLQKQGHQKFLKRYLRREEILKQLAGCNASLQEALGMFSLSIQIRILKQVQETQNMMREMMERDRLASMASLVTISRIAALAGSSSSTVGLVEAGPSSASATSSSSNALQLSGVLTAHDPLGTDPSAGASAVSRLLVPQQHPKFPYQVQPLAGMIMSAAETTAGLPPSSSHPSLSNVSLGPPSSQAGSSGTVTPTMGNRLGLASEKVGIIPATPSPPATPMHGSAAIEATEPFSPVVSAPFTFTTAFTSATEDQSAVTPDSRFIPASQVPPENVMMTLASLRQEQSELDAAADLADLRNRMRGALGSGNDAEIMEVLGVRRDEMPEAIKTLQRALERIMEQERMVSVETTSGASVGTSGGGEQSIVGSGVISGSYVDAAAEVEPASGMTRPKFPRASSRRTLTNMARRLSMQNGSSGVGNGVAVEDSGNLSGAPREENVSGQKDKGKKRMSISGLKRSKTVSTTITVGTASTHSSSKGTGSSGESRPSSGISRDTLDREFIEMGIDAMRRMSRTPAKDLNLPSWTITQFEIETDEKVGIGFFSDVYRGTWRQRTVAVKVLAETTPRKLFQREMGIWKSLRHPNVLELYGASSASSDPPWFFVSPYLKNGTLPEFLKHVTERGIPLGLTLSAGHDSLRSRTGSLPSWPGGGLGSLVGSSLSVGRDREAAMGIGLGLGLGMTSANSSSHQHTPSGAGGRGRSGSGSSVLSGEVAKEWDLLKFMHEIAKGMEYLHSHGVLHGDLKASNVLVDDRIHCVISDFGQSEMKSEAFRISGTPLPHGTLRWQAPELMLGAIQFTVEMDVYAFSICCIEILSMGRLPWPLMDDDTVRHVVLHEKSRPHIPSTRFSTQDVQDLLRRCWASDPFDRPSFSEVARDLKLLRRNAGYNSEDVQSPRVPDWADRDRSPQISRPSPDMHPIPLPGSSPRDTGYNLSTSPQSSDAASFRTARDLSLSPTFPSLLSHREETVTTSRVQRPEPVTYTPSETSSDTSSIFTSTPSDSGDEARNALLEYDGYDSPPPANDIIAEQRNERRYRLLLQHDFHPSLVLPLWSPSPVGLGAVGFLSKPRGTFVTLFNAFNPEKSSNVAVRGLPSVHGYGRLSTGSQRQDKRNAALRGLDAIAGLLTFKSRGDGTISQSVSRRYSFPLRAGHKTAHMCTETTVYRYVDSLDAPKKWFKANVDAILEIFGSQHHIQKEDLFLVIGTLDTPDYGLFGHFNVFTAARTGQPWGTFTTDTGFPTDVVGPSYHEPVTENSLSASKVSPEGAPWNTLLIARLRFKPDVLDPTST
ncbi:hypothetical protein D9758_009617 [Tetrapyrgos nigripes]|uniref:Protein kinase domain-containing protein n=1 Tax=Tetrapyrgos nigripes TaxID=182062 RepID=A0A8H5LMM1_9AGAR|nr:hypothetical protein D9758_009617 [Tetrapyrgos nigripes]